MLGKVPIRFAFLNVEGLVTKKMNKLQCAEIKDLFQNNEIVLFNETWTSEMSNLDVENFEYFALHRTQRKINAKRDSGGIIIYVRSELYNSNMLVKTDCDDIIWLKFEPGIISDKTLYLCLCYVLPSGTSRQPIVETSVFDRLSDDIALFQSYHNDSECSFIVCGDLNARTKDLPDMVVDDNSIHLPLPDDYILDEFIPSTSQDKNMNSNGTLLLEFCKQTNMRILNGRHGSDKGVGKFTCHTHRGQSVVDYVLVSTDILPLICSFDIGEPNILSDHSILHVSIWSKSQFADNTPSDEENATFIQYKYAWDSNLVHEYKTQLNSPDILGIFDEARNILNTEH